MSPIPAGDKYQGTSETVLLTRNVDGSVDKVKQKEEEASHLKKHRPVSRRFSGVHRPNQREIHLLKPGHQPGPALGAHI